MAGINERATAIFSSHKHKVSGMLEPQQGPYALALVGAMLGMNQKQLGERGGRGHGRGELSWGASHVRGKMDQRGAAGEAHNGGAEGHRGAEGGTGA
jgi:hypothetical protein